MAGVSVAVMCRFSPGELLPKPTLPLLATNSEFVGAPAVIVNGTFDPVMSSIENLFAPPQASLAVSCQSLFGQPAVVDVSSNLMRVLFSFRRMVSKPKLSLFTQSRPTQRLPWMIASSAVTTSSAFTFPRPLAMTFLPPGGAGSTTLSETNELPLTMKEPEMVVSRSRPASALSRSTSAWSSRERAAARLAFVSAEMRGITRNCHVYWPSAFAPRSCRCRTGVAPAANSFVIEKSSGPLTTSAMRSNVPNGCHWMAEALMLMSAVAGGSDTGLAANAVAAIATTRKMKNTLRAYLVMRSPPFVVTRKAKPAVTPTLSLPTDVPFGLGAHQYRHAEQMCPCLHKKSL